MAQAYVSSAPTPYPVFARPTRYRVVAGVAAGLAEHLKVDVFYVRVAFVVLSLISGLGLLAYAGVWLTTSARPDLPAPPDDKALSRPANLALVVAGVMAAFIATVMVANLSLAVLFPLVIAAVGAFLAWQAYDRGASSAVGVIAFTVGAVLVVGGLGIAIVWWDTGGMAGSLAAVALTLMGVIVLAGPAVLRLWESAMQSKAEKVVADERAEIASRLHDSVLQTLALIQKRADDPDEVARLARAQERELRGWLFEPEERTAEQTVFAALGRAAGEVEDMFGVRIAPVTVGTDPTLDDASHAVVLAAREAMVNAAKHAGVEMLDVYAENIGGQLAVFVRDRGVGFDPDQIPADRHGIRESIRARVEKAGGQVRLTSAPGEGTEVELTLP